MTPNNVIRDGVIDLQLNLTFQLKFSTVVSLRLESVSNDRLLKHNFRNMITSIEYGYQCSRKNFKKTKFCFPRNLHSLGLPNWNKYNFKSIWFGGHKLWEWDLRMKYRQSTKLSKQSISHLRFHWFGIRFHPINRYSESVFTRDSTQSIDSWKKILMNLTIRRTFWAHENHLQRFFNSFFFKVKVIS